MGFFNQEAGKTQQYKKELESKTDEELEKIAKTEVRTSFFGLSSGVDKQMQVAAFELLRERKAKKTKTCPFCAETILEAAKVCRYCGRDV